MTLTYGKSLWRITIKTDNNGVKLTVVQEVNNEDVGRNSAILPLQVIRRLDLFGEDVIGIEGQKKTCTIAFLDQRTGYIDIDGYTRHAAGVGIGEMVTIREARVKDAKTVEFQVMQGRSAIEADAGMGPDRGRGYGDNTTSPIQA
ncbi:MAG: hypothetical protein NTW33_10555 [Methanoregula sp.]|nr:hypothetical protein [Methanoregula sp.]